MHLPVYTEHAPREYVHYSVVKPNGEIAATALEDFTSITPEVTAALNTLSVGTYTLVATVKQTPSYGAASDKTDFIIVKAYNGWNTAPVVQSWVAGKFDASVNTIVGDTVYGDVSYVITDIDGNVYYDEVNGVDNRASMKTGTYLLKAHVAGTDNYFEFNDMSVTFQVLEKVGMPWWGTFLIVMGVLLVVAAVLFILWKKGVIRLLSDKLILAIRTKATVDATIAAIRANKRAEEAKLTVARAKAQEASEARRAAAAAERAKPAEERAAALEEKAQQAAERAQRMAARAEAMRVRAESLRARAADNEKAIDAAMEEVAADEDAGKEE